MDKTSMFGNLIAEKTKREDRQRSQVYRPQSPNNLCRSRDDEFITRTAILQTGIARMRSYLFELGKDYLNLYTCLQVSASQISDQVDLEIQKFLKDSMQTTDYLRIEIESNLRTMPKQLIQHRLAVIDILRRDLSEFARAHQRLSEARTKRVYDKQLMDPLEKPGTLLDYDHEAIPETNSITSIELDSQSGPSDKLDHSTNFSSIKTKRRNIIVASQEGSTDYTSLRDNLHNRRLSGTNQQYADELQELNETTLTQQELQILAHENSVIHDEMLSVEDEIKTIGSKVVQIAKLQQLFTEKVMEQEVELERLHETTVRSSENVKEGNELIRDAMKNNASLRAFFLFYILLLGFTILFLDWYND